MANKTRKVHSEKKGADEKTAILRDPTQMIPYVNFPKEKHGSVKTSGVKSITVKPVRTDDQMKAREGTYWNEKEIETIYDEDIDVYVEDDKEGKRLLARFRKNVIPHDMLENAWISFYKTAAPSRNRGAAAGPIDLKSAYWKKRKPTQISKWSAKYMQNGKESKMRVNNNVFSSVLGYFEETPFMGLPCRLTSYTQKYFQEFSQGTKFLEYIDGIFQKLVPGPHAAQLKQARVHPQYQIGDTAFTSVTLNRNFRTAQHQDAGDFRGGFGNLTVLEYGRYHGGYTVFPQYGIGFNIRTGDFIAMDVHTWHCNTEYTETAEDKEYNKKIPKIYDNNESTGTLGQDKPFTRISFVCYLREKIPHCDTKETSKYYSSIGFKHKNGRLIPNQKLPNQYATRKKKRDSE